MQIVHTTEVRCFSLVFIRGLIIFEKHLEFEREGTIVNYFFCRIRFRKKDIL